MPSCQRFWNTCSKRNSMNKIDVFLPSGTSVDSILQWRDHPLAGRVYLYGAEASQDVPEGCLFLPHPGPAGSMFIQAMAGEVEDGYCLLVTGNLAIRPGPHALERMIHTAEATGAGWVYADHTDLVDGTPVPHPVIDYQRGSLRDQFDFGPLVLLHGPQVREAASGMKGTFQHAGLYQLRLAMSRISLPLRIPEPLYTVLQPGEEQDGQGTGMFTYVDPGNRHVQLEMEEVVTAHLKALGGYLEPRFREPQLERGSFEVEASVIIPVLNRIRTLPDAVESVMAQKCTSRFNLLVVDNHSTDGTTDYLRQAASRHPRLVHLIPERKDLGIGGCWDLAVHDPRCGRFAVQLDSDDLYSDPACLQEILDTFYREQCAMVIGSYRITNFDLEEIPPGLIDHREWTPGNGRNNALRINGLGAPRAFFTPVLRETGIPNVSYGEDYAVGLAISREYRIGRIYRPLYLCRRWEDNSDASLDIRAANRNDYYKDWIRTCELLARIRMVKGT